MTRPEGELSEGIEVFEVKRGDILQVVSTSGSIDSKTKNTYTLQVSGKVISALEKGDSFKKGDILVEVDKQDALVSLERIEKEIQAAESSLRVAQINYQKALDANHIAIQLAEINAQKAEESTQNALKSLEEANANARLSYESARMALQDAREILEMAESDPSVDDMQLAQYESNVKSAEEKLESSKISGSSSVSQAESSYGSSILEQSSTYWNNLSNLQSAKAQIELTRENLTQARINVEQARMDYEAAQKELNKYIIYAPYDGTVVSSDYREGEYTGSGGSGISIINNDFVVKVTVAENEVSKVSPGMEATITLDAYPDIELAGSVERIILVPVEGSEIVSYEVLIEFKDPSAVKLIYGLSANVSIVVNKAENVLYVPLQAVYKENGRSYVDVLERVVSGREGAQRPTQLQSIKKVEITTGINDYYNIEVTSGLKEGDIVVLSRVE
ncbi:MAG: HlyD family efflux transporter periplasmic adaptor subunit [Actinobacteria bacterium]|nr:HlyD family efflux transporter periplasmic adaptor subunit [Actinomycetota bacterium]